MAARGRQTRKPGLSGLATPLGDGATLPSSNATGTSLNHQRQELERWQRRGWPPTGSKASVPCIENNADWVRDASVLIQPLRYPTSAKGRGQFLGNDETVTVSPSSAS